MRIKESKNLTFDKFPFMVGHPEGFDHLDSETCVLQRSERIDDKIIFYFKNGTQASIKAINIEGGREIDLIERKIIDLIEKNYQEILNTEI
ncbi:MAG: hypothetical protein ABID67_01365 [Candidatus Nealsonbacteria bacterium]